MKVSMRIYLWLIKHNCTLVGFLPGSVERYEDSESPETDANRSSVFWFTGRDKVQPEKSCKHDFYGPKS